MRLSAFVLLILLFESNSEVVKDNFVYKPNDGTEQVLKEIDGRTILSINRTMVLNKCLKKLMWLKKSKNALMMLWSAFSIKKKKVFFF